MLVSTQDDRPFAKVIDFGIAQAISQRLTDETLFTQHDQFLGTPQSLSPEQAEGSVDIDTRTDDRVAGGTRHTFQVAAVRRAARTDFPATGLVPFVSTQLWVFGIQFWFS